DHRVPRQCPAGRSSDAGRRGAPAGTSVRGQSDMIADSGRSTAELVGTRGGPRIYLVHNAALEDLLFDRNLTGVEFRRACFECSRHFLAHLADELPSGDTAELMILSKGLIYQLGAAMAAETGLNLPT